MKTYRSIALSVSLFLSLYPLDVSARSNPATRITFAPNSSCGSYTGKIVGQKTFVLNIAPYDEQLLYVYSTRGGQLSQVTVRNSRGVIQGHESSHYGIQESQTVYPIARKGDYSISLSSKVSPDTIVFCVIDNPHGEKP